MESKVYEAALEGSVSSLLKLLEQDARILDRCSVLGVEGNPLHIAALHGHAHFAKEIINRKPEFVRELNSQGYLPLHLASAKRNVEMVKDLLQADPETCLVRDPDGRIPLHTAAIKGRVEVLEALVSAKPVTTRVLTKGGESILHLCLKQENDLFKCIKKLVELVDVKERGEFVNMKDNDDNTILHLSTANKQFQTIDFLLGKTTVDVNALNVNGFTALDILESSEESCAYGKIERRLRSAGAKRSTDSNDNNGLQILEWAWVCSGGSKSKKELEKEEASLNDSRNTLVVVAILIATVTYTSGLTPPGGFWQGEFKKNEVEFNTTATESNRTAITDHSEVAFLAIKENEGESNKTANEGPLNRTAIDDYSGVAVLAIKNNVAYSYYIIFNSIGFLASLSIILLLISGFPIRRKACRITLMVILWIAISSMVITYTVGVINTCSWAIIPGKAPRKRTVTFLSLGVMGILLLGGPFIRLIAQLRRRFVIPMQCVIPKENEKKKVVDV
ncbi:uncharacterized protein LOC143879318 isoform X1 [Tasmannia lanceolata]|uniref:uncharacterized protein LOC143879318 isoform X1 n=1 Tax=Tasmannia lanceolata TaxID=3420 RepID=UPI0040634F9D